MARYMTKEVAEKLLEEGGEAILGGQTPNGGHPFFGYPQLYRHLGDDRPPGNRSHAQ